MSKGIIVAGNLLVDALKEIDVYPEHSHLTSIRKMSRATGGLCCNCALDLARLDPDLPITAVGVAGDDEYGRFIRAEMGKCPNISLEHVRTGGATSFTDVMYDRANRTRTFFTYRGASDELCPADFDFDKLQGDLIHIGYILLLAGLDAPDAEYGTAMARVLADAKAHGIATSIDLVSEEGDRYAAVVAPALKYADYCVINETEAERITGVSLTTGDGCVVPERAFEALDKLLRMGVARRAVIHSRNESLGVEAGGARARVPSIDLPRAAIAGTTGAGDAFCSGMLYASWKGMDLDGSMRFATAVATASLLTPGASDGILTYEQTLAFGAEYTARYGEVRL